MNHITGNRLYDLLPGIYRKRDLEGDQALRHLADVVYGELVRSEKQIRDLYESWFIETCPEQVVPQIAALLGFHIDPDPGGFPTHRAMVANAMSNRQAKGTVQALERGASEASGWAIEVVEFFERMAANAPMQPSLGGTGMHREARVDQETDASVGQTVDIRRRSEDGARRGGGNLQEIELRVARMMACPLEHVSCRSNGEGGFRLHPLDVDAPVFHQRCHDPVLALAKGMTRLPVRMELPVVRGDLERHLVHARRRAESPSERTAWLGPDRSLSLIVDGESVPAWQMEVVDLSDWARPGPNLEGWRSGPVVLEFDDEAPAMRLERDGHSSRKLRLARAPTSLEDAATLLRAAIRRLGADPVFRDCEVVALHDSLLVFLGERIPASSWRLQPAEDDPGTWSALGFQRATATSALLSAEVDWEWSVPARTALRLTVGDAASMDIDVAFDRGSLASMANAMQVALSEHGAWQVLCMGAHLLIVPPRRVGTAPMRVRSTGRDCRALRILGLHWSLRIDPSTGRVQLPLGFEGCEVRADWAFGSLAPIGAGPYGRVMVGPAPEDQWCAVVSKGHDEGASSGRFGSLSAALDAWTSADSDGYIRVLDSAMYTLGAETGTPLTLTLGGRSLTIEAADGEQPTLLGDLHASLGGGTLNLVGMLHDGRTVFETGGSVSLQHMTTRAELDVRANDRPLHLTADRCIIGPVRFASLFGGAEFRDCILGQSEGIGISGGDNHEYAPTASFLRSTVLGEVHLGELADARDSLFIGAVSVRRRHVGSIRSCAVPAHSTTCRRVHCFEFWTEETPPSGSLVKDSLPPPSFVSLRFGDPGFAQLATEAHSNFRSGASNGHELGVYNSVRQHDRLRFLKASVHEYLPVGWWADIQFVN